MRWGLEGEEDGWVEKGDMLRVDVLGNFKKE